MKNMKILGVVLAFAIFAFPCASYGEDKVFRITLDEFVLAYNENLQTTKEEPLIPSQLENMPESRTLGSKKYAIDSNGTLVIAFSKPNNMVAAVMYVGRRVEPIGKYNSHIMSSIIVLAKTLGPLDSEFKDFILDVLVHNRASLDTAKVFNYLDIEVTYTAEKDRRMLIIARK